MTVSFAPACRRQLCAVLVGLFLGSMALRVQANELPLASRSAMMGITFEDRPLALPLQVNFRMAMLSASTELGRSCGKMEAYGWRMASSEQGRADQIFNATVEHMRNQGYFIQSETPAAVSRDITIFTADRLNQHFIFMWSAGEIGLVMVACESSPPLTGRAVMAAGRRRAENPLAAQDVVQGPPTGKNEPIKGAFTPVGVWKGEYTCLPQGYTGATLQITRMKGDDFEGEFHFYPTPKNALVPEGRYEVYGQYDLKSHRILINPGKWLQRPKDYANSVMVGGFDVAARTISAYFQGVNGCTSFEAKYISAPAHGKPVSAVKKKKHAHAHVTAKVGKHEPSAARGKKGRKSPAQKTDGGFKSLKPVVIGGPGDQGSASPLPPTSKRIDNDFSSAINGNDRESNRPYAKPEAEVPQYATETDEKTLQDKTPAARLYAVPSQTKKAAATATSAQPASDEEGSKDTNSGGASPQGKETNPPKEDSSEEPDDKTGESPKPESSLNPTRLIEKPVRLASSAQWISPQAPAAPGPSMIAPVAPAAPAPAIAPPPARANSVPPAASGPSHAALPVARNYVAPEAPAPDMVTPRAPSAPEPEYVSDAGGAL